MTKNRGIFSKLAPAIDSEEFQKILKIKAEKRYGEIRAITHSVPLLVFWITPEGIVLDAKNAHHDNPPHDDRSLLSDPTHKGHLRGRAAYIGNVIYVFIYGYGKTDHFLTMKQIKLLEKSYLRLLTSIQNLNPHISRDDIDRAQFRTELGKAIN